MKRSPAAALLLSILPGAGHVYLGQPSKGLILIVSFASAIYLSAEGAGAFFGILIPFVFVFSMIDAHRTAIAMNHLVDTGQPPPPTSDMFALGKWWGWALIVVGVVFTLDNYGWFGFDIDWVIDLWPLGLIALGLYLLKRPDPVTRPATPTDVVPTDPPGAAVQEETADDAAENG